MKWKFWTGWFKKENTSENEPLKNAYQSGSFTMDWIEDENLLKDEAVLTAAAESDPECKLNTIKEYFDGKVAVAEESLTNLKQRYLDMQVDEKNQSGLVQETEKKLIELNQMPSTALQSIFRHFLGLLLYVAMCGGYMFFIYELIKPYFGDSAMYIAIGIGTIGFFALYNSRSVLFKSNKAIQEDSDKKGGPELWKVLLEEISVPLVVSAFVVYWGWYDRPVWGSLLIVVATFVVFFAAGKGLLSTITKLRDEFATAAINRRLRKQRRLELKQHDTKLKEQQAELKATRQKLVELDKQIEETGGQRYELISKGKALVSLFQGEYDLAKTALRTLTHHQISTITEDGVLEQA